MIQRLLQSGFKKNGIDIDQVKATYLLAKINHFSEFLDLDVLESHDNKVMRVDSRGQGTQADMSFWKGTYGGFFSSEPDITFSSKAMTLHVDPSRIRINHFGLRELTIKEKGVLYWRNVHIK